MKRICKHFSGWGKIGFSNLLLTFFSLALSTSSCTDETDTPSRGTSLQLNVKAADIESRGLIESAALPDGHSIGLTLTDAGGYTYDNISYKNIKATASTGTTPQTWALANDMLLSSTAGTLYGYYPYNSAVTDITQVPITAGDTDYMYATPVENLNDGNYNATITMNHALTAIRVTVCKAADNDDEATLNCLRVQSEAFCQSATLDATTGTLTGLDGTGIEQQKTSLGQVLSFAGSTYDFMVIPGNGSNDMTFTATINNQEFVGTVDNVTLQQGYIYSYTLTFSRQERKLTITKQSVSPWNRHDKISMGMQLKNPWDAVDYVDESSVANGVYAVAPNGKLVADINAVSEEMQKECIAVAVVVNDAPVPQKLWVEKYGESNAAYNGNTLFFWDKSYSDLSGIVNAVSIDGTNNYGYLPLESGQYYSTPEISDEYQTWTRLQTYLEDVTTGGDGTFFLADYYGSSNSSDVINTATYALDIGYILSKFNADTNQNVGYSDWFIPAGGQLGLIYLNKSYVNNMLSTIGGTVIEGGYWSCTEYTSNGAWYLGFNSGYIGTFGKDSQRMVRFVRSF